MSSLPARRVWTIIACVSAFAGPSPTTTGKGDGHALSVRPTRVVGG